MTGRIAAPISVSVIKYFYEKTFSAHLQEAHAECHYSLITDHLIPKHILQRELLDLAELGEGVEVHVGLFAESHIDFLLAFDVFVVEVHDVLHRHLGIGIEKNFITSFLHIVTHLFVVQVGVDDTHLCGAFGAAQAEHRLFGTG